MSADVGLVLADVLREQVRDVPLPAPGLVDRARHAARRRRRRQVVALGATAAVVLAALVAPAALGGGDDSRATPLPAGPSGRLVDLDPSGGDVTAIDATALGSGPDPATAWTASGILHRTDGRSLQLPDGAVGAVELPDGGAAVTGGTSVRPTVSLVDVEGHAQPLFAATAPVVHPDGQVAYIDLERHLVVRDEPGGTDAAVAVPFPDGGLSLVGFLGDDLVVDTPSGSARVVRRDGTWAPIPGLPLATATDPRSRTVALRSRDGGCLELRRGPALLWRTCSNVGRFTSIVAISSDGHHVLLRRDMSGNPGTSEYAVAVAGTGRVLRLFSADGDTLGLGQAAFERDGVLISAYHDGVSRIVRCDLDGVCEVATGDAGASPSPFTPVWFP
jgi:hypothetical protein